MYLKIYVNKTFSIYGLDGKVEVYYGEVISGCCGLKRSGIYEFTDEEQIKHIIPKIETIPEKVKIIQKEL